MRARLMRVVIAMMSLIPVRAFAISSSATAVLSFHSLMVLQLLGSWMYRKIKLRMEANGSSFSAWTMRQKARLIQGVDRATPDPAGDMADGVG